MPPAGKKIKKRPENLRLGNSKFKFPNGDRYHGEFIANAKTKTIMRYGLGTYRTWDGIEYTAMWDNDVFAKNAEIQIRYPDNSIYKGPVSKMLDYTEGIYQFYDGSQIKCKFSKNVPTEASIIFTDHNGMPWDHKFFKQFLVLRHPNTFLLDREDEEEQRIALSEEK